MHCLASRIALLALLKVSSIKLTLRHLRPVTFIKVDAVFVWAKVSGSKRCSWMSELQKSLQLLASTSKYAYIITNYHTIHKFADIPNAFVEGNTYPTRREFLREILYKSISIIAIQHSKMYFFDTFGDFSRNFGEILYKNIVIIAIQHSKMYFVDTFGDFSHKYCWVKFTQVRLANFPIHISLNSPCVG